MGSPGGDSNMKQTRMLVVSLRGVNFGFWSRLGCSEQSANISCREETQNSAKRNRSQIFSLDESIQWLCLYIIKSRCMFYLCVFKRSLLEVKTCLSHAQIGLLYGSLKAWATPRWSALGVKFKLSDEHPGLFHMGVPPPGTFSEVSILGTDQKGVGKKRSQKLRKFQILAVVALGQHVGEQKNVKL